MAPADRKSLLIGDLDALRQRTLDMADLESSRYSRMSFPHLEEVLESSPWAGLSRVEGLRQLLGDAAEVCANRGAVEMLFGLADHKGDAVALAAKALAKLGRGGVSDTTKTRLIRGLRESLAVALIEREAGRLLADVSLTPVGPYDPVTNKLVRWSDRLVADLSAQFEDLPVQEIPGVRGESLYVRRQIQPVLLGRLNRVGHKPQIVRGDAGFGKSSLLWGLYVDLRQLPDVFPVFVSATWLSAQAGEVGVFSVDEIVGAARVLASVHERVVVLLDTADLLLHSDVSQGLMADLIGFLTADRVGLVVATRPLEAEQGLPANIGSFEDLGMYAEEEMTIAVERLARRFVPDHSPSESIDAVRTAVARGWPVSEICTSPLLLRMLFDLSGGVPPGMEIDVSGLYLKYWEHRVRDDRRLFRAGRARAGRDLSASVRACAVSMLAMGTPEPERDVMEELVEQLASSPGSRIISGAGDIEEIMGRGIVKPAGPRVRFFHQTMFEFAAAMELLARGPAPELERLTSFMVDYPTDLFRGAVLEQFLVLASRNPVAGNAVNSSIERLLSAGHVALESIALAVWAHNPAMVSLPHESLTAVSTTALVRVARIVPTVGGVFVADKLSILERVWAAQNTRVAAAVITALDRVRRSHPAEAYDFYIRNGCLDFILGPGSAMLANAAPFFELLVGLASADTIAIRIDLCRLLAALSGTTMAVTVLDLIADQWELVGDAPFVEQVVATIEASQVANGDTQGRSIRRALGRVIAAQFDRESRPPVFWNELARQTRNQLIKDDANVRAGANLFVLAWHIGRLERSAEIDLLFGILLTFEAVKAPRKLTANFLVPVLEQESAARTALISRLQGMLVALPVTPNTLGDEGGVWASVARSALEDQRVPPEIVVSVLAGLTPSKETLFASRSYAISLLPAAVRADDMAATDILDRIRRGDFEVEDNSLTKLLQEARIHLEYSRPLADAYVDLAIRRTDTGLLTTTVEVPFVEEALNRSAERLSSMLRPLLVSNGGRQREAAALWKALQEAGVLIPGVTELGTALDTATDPTARSILVGMLPDAADEDSFSSAATILAKFGTLNEVTGQIQPPADRKIAAGLIDAVSDSLLRILSHHAPMSEATTKSIVALCVRPKVNQDDALDVSGFRHANRYLSRIVETGLMTEAVAALIRIGKTLYSQTLRSKQQRNASNALHYGARKVVEGCSAQQLTSIIEAFPEMTPVLSLFIARAALQTHPFGARDLLEAALGKSLPEGLAEPIAADLRERSRFGGSDAMPGFMYRATETS